MTAADAQADYMCHTVPQRARLLVVSACDFWRKLLRDRDAERYASWTIQTSLSDEEAMEWAVEAGTNFHSAKHLATVSARPLKEVLTPLVVVALFLDGNVTPDHDSPSSWCYQLIKHCSFLLSHGAHLIYTADDSFVRFTVLASPISLSDLSTCRTQHSTSVSREASSHCLVRSSDIFPCDRRCNAGPGMFASMLLPIMPPGSDNDGRWACCGKGGNVGHQYMVEKAISMLRAQGHDGNRSSILLVGDRFATDIRAGNRAGIKTCLVESGCNHITDQPYFPTDVPSYWAPSIGHLKNTDHDAGPNDDRCVGRVAALHTISAGF